MKTLLEIFENYTVKTVGGPRVTVNSIVLTGNGRGIVATTNDASGGQVHTFEPDAEAVNAHGNTFGAVDKNTGKTIMFSAFKEIPACFSDNPRAIDIGDARFEQAEPNRFEFKVSPFDIRVNRTDEGVVVDVWAFDDDVSDEPLASCYAFDVDAMPDEEKG